MVENDLRFRLMWWRIIQDLAVVVENDLIFRLMWWSIIQDLALVVENNLRFGCSGGE